MNAQYDVIVIGAGGAGLAAALTAATSGVSVLVVEAGSRVGGSTALSGGVMYAAGTRVQRDRGIVDDSAQAMFRYYMTVNQWKVDAGMVNVLCQNAAQGLEWLMSLGVDFPAENLYAAGLDGVLRGHRAAGLGVEIIDVLEGRVNTMPTIDMALRSRVEGFTPRSNGAASITVNGANITGRSVIISTGGFGANRALIARLVPKVDIYGDWVRYIGATTNRGDGLLLAERAGGAIVGAGRVSALLTPNFSMDFEPYTPDWLVFVDRTGNRFINETLDYTVVPGAVADLPHNECLAIFDESARLQAKSRIAPDDAKKVYAYSSWTAEQLEQMSREGRILKADSIEDLATKAAINPGALSTTVAKWNRDCAAGYDTQFLKAANYLKPISTPPYYAVLMRPAVVGATHSGLRCDQEGRVLSTNGPPISGLFAAGEVVGNVLGDRYVGGGNAISSAIVFGRIAGRMAAAEAMAQRGDAWAPECSFDQRR